MYISNRHALRIVMCNRLGSAARDTPHTYIMLTAVHVLLDIAALYLHIAVYEISPYSSISIYRTMYLYLSIYID